MLYAGFDCSTQSLSVAVIDVTGSRGDVVFRDTLVFDADLPEFKTRHGVTLEGPDGVVHTTPLLWTTALERMLQRLAAAVDVRRLRALSGSAQQHGSVYCGETPGILTRASSPIWMDTSTAAECAEIEAALGGAQTLAQLTGSRAFPRFTGPQIRKFAREDPGAYAATHRIHLVSSYLASWLLGAHASIDHADGSGMNLMDLRTRGWSQAAMSGDRARPCREAARARPLECRPRDTRPAVARSARLAAGEDRGLVGRQSVQPRGHRCRGRRPARHLTRDERHHLRPDAGAACQR